MLPSYTSVYSVATSLPKKCLLEINGKKNIEFLIDWLKRSKLADMIIVCTTENEEDNILCDIAKNKGQVINLELVGPIAFEQQEEKCLDLESSNELKPRRHSKQ